MCFTWEVIVRETCFCEKIQTVYKLSWVFQKYFNFVRMLESRNVDRMKGDFSWDMLFCEKILADCTLSWVFQKYFNFVPMLESRNVDHVKSICSWNMFSRKNSGKLHSFMSFSKIFQLSSKPSLLGKDTSPRQFHESAISQHLLDNAKCALHFNKGKFSVVARARTPFCFSSLEPTLYPC